MQIKIRTTTEYPLLKPPYPLSLKAITPPTIICETNIINPQEINRNRRPSLSTANIGMVAIPTDPVTIADMSDALSPKPNVRKRIGA